MSAPVQTRTSSISGSLKTGMKAALNRLEEHHRSVQGAYESYYGQGYSRSGSAASSAANSRSSSVDKTATPQGPSAMSKAWKSIKERAAEHHRSVNATYSAHYGQGY